MLSMLAPEFRLLCLAARPCPDDARLEIEIAARPDWPAVIEGARRHRIVPLVLASLRRHDTGHLEAVVGELLRVARTEATRSLATAAETARLGSSFDAAGVRALVLKGSPLSQMLYGNVVTRGSGDIDLLVDANDFWAADAVLTTLGYRLDGAPISPRRRASGQHLLRDLVYRRDGHVVELHQRLTANPRCLPTDFAALWCDRDRIDFGGFSVPTLPRRFLPVYLCVHGAGHHWDRLRWLIDLALVLGDRDRAAVALADAEAVGLGRAMRLAQALAAEWLGLAIDAADTDAARRFTARLYAGDRWRAATRDGTFGGLRRMMWRRHYNYTMKGTWSHVCAELATELADPVDWSVIRLPDQLLWLYPPLRPVGWVLRSLRRGRSGRGG